MFDLHCHILPGIDDGAADLEVSLAMAEAFVADGVSVVACTPHILPGVYPNTPEQIRAATDSLQHELTLREIPLQLVWGADIHIVPGMARALKSGALLPIAETRYLLVEPPHHIAPARMDDAFFDLMLAGYVPILTHPERLRWIEHEYAMIERLAHSGVWMQVTAGSVLGTFGSRPRYWAERMLDEGIVHIIASDAHNMQSRPPLMAEAHAAIADWLGDEEAWDLVFTRPHGVLMDESPASLPMPVAIGVTAEQRA
ncbi:MAG: tyrosine-protein phosphatase [Parvibaculaceae bacterium]